MPFNMSDVKARPVVKNKFWIVESNGQKTATIQAVDEGGGFVYVHDEERELFPSIKLLSKKYNIEFVKANRTATSTAYEIHGYPTPHKPYNVLFDVKKKLPIFTKAAKSKSFYCAGYYLVRLGNHWTTSYCPKAITLNRYQYQGPFKTSAELAEAKKLV